MKQLLCLILAAGMLLSLAACGKEPARQDPQTETPPAASQPEAAVTLPPETDAPTDPPPQVHPLEETVLVDDSNCAFSVTGATSNGYTGMELQVLCENKTDRTVIFSWDAVSVCGYMYDPLWSQKVGPGETVASTVSIDTYALEAFGIFSVDEISFGLNVFDEENWMDAPLVNQVFTIYPTGLTADAVVYPAREHTEAETVILDRDGVTFLIEGTGGNDLTYTLRCFLTNTTEHTLMFSWEDVTVNGCPVSPAWSATVAPGKSAYSTVTIFRSELEDAGIADVEEIGFKLVVSDYDDWSAGYLVDSSYTYNP